MKKYIVSFLIALFLLTTIYNKINVQASENTETEITSVNNLQDAANYLKSEMINRNNSITFNYLGEHLTSTNVVNIYNEAIAHNGISNEGDYISGHINSYEYQYYHLTNGEDLYTQVTYTFIWLTTAEMEDEVTVRVKEVLDELNVYEKSQYEKIKAIYDYICDNVRYDHDHLETEETQLPHSAYAAIINNKAVCQGYATLLYRMLLEVGVDCRYITGYSGEERHSWNIVEIDGLYYNVDSTWDRGLSVYYRYFLCTEYNFAGHERDSRYQTTAFYQEYPMAEVPYGVEAQASGTLTNTMSWYLEKDGTLTITGSGRMPDFHNISAPWYPYINSIKTIIIEEGITTIGSYAFTRCKLATSASLPSTLLEIHTYGFDNCRSLKSITLPYGLVRIDTNAFSECVALTRVELPDTVTTVGSSVFSTCYNLKYVKLSAGMKSIPDSMFFNMDSLTTVIIPDGITEIGDTVFRGSDGITSITIPKQISKIGVAAFADCLKLSNIYVDSENPYFTSVNGVLYSKDMTKLISYPCAKTASAYNVPTGVLSLEYASFGSARYLTQLGLPESLTKIDTYAFSWCSNLTSVTIGPNVSYVGDSAFGWCTNLRSVTFKNPNTTFDWHSFTDCTSLTSIVLPSNLKIIPTGLFSDCKSLTNIVIPNTVTMIDDSAFSYCESLKTFTIPSSVSILGYGVFSYCSNLEVVNINGNIRSVDWSCFSNCNNLKFINIKGDLTGVDSTAFKNTPVKSVYIESNNALSRIVSTSSFGNMMNTVKTVAVLKSLTNVPTFVTNKYTRTCVIEYNDQFYRLYSDHSHIWYSYGNNQYYCNVCNAIKDNHTHSYTVYVTEPTCTSSGYSTYVCQCEYSYTANYTSPIAHSFNTWVETIAPTCQTTGQAERTCSVCGEVEYLELLTISHNQTVINAVEPTCTESGLTEGSYCDRCNTILVAQLEIAPLGHNFDDVTYKWSNDYLSITAERICKTDNAHTETETVSCNYSIIYDSTCTTEGLGRYTSNEFLNNAFTVQIYDEIIALKAHDYQLVVTEPTCLTQGYTTYTCHCGDSYTDDYTAALGHNFSEWVVEKEPTCNTEGKDNRVCNRCEYKDSRDTRYSSDETKVLVSNRLPDDYFNGKKIICIGDSLTNGTGVLKEERYQELLGVSLGATIKSAGISGGVLSFGGHLPGRFDTCMTTKYLDGADVVTIFLGINDWDNGVINGTYQGKLKYDESLTYYGLGYFGCDDSTTIYGATKVWCERILELKQTAGLENTMFVFATPVITSYNKSVTYSKDWNQEKVNVFGHTLREYCEAIMEVCAYYNVPVLDLNMYSGMYYHSETDNNVEYFGGDGIHPGVNGHKMMAEAFEEFLLENYSYEERSITHNTHNYKQTIKHPTCEAQGYTKYNCMDCYYTYVANYTDALGHSYESKVTLPTCETQGYTTYTCHCGDSYIDNYTDALGHSYESKVTLPTCEAKGYTTYTCHCGDSYIDNYTDALGHDIVELEAKEETCTEPGLTQGEYCTRCDYKVVQEIVPAKGHKYEAKATLPTCEAKGYTTYTCHCGDSYIDNYTDELGHDIVELEAKEETCTEPGLTKGEYCTRCDYKVAQEIVPAKGHKYEAKVTLPTCETQGYTTYTCHCGDSYIDDYIDALGHDIVELEAKEETCTETGLTQGEYCTRCDYKVTQEIIPAKGHKYEAKVTEATCLTKGYTTYTCKCGDSYIDDYIDALGHNIVELEAKEETCTETGLTKGEYCTRCDYKVTQEIIPAKGHKYETKVTLPTCEAQGYTTYTCHCGDSYIDNYAEALGHAYGNWSLLTEPTLKHKGLIVRICSNDSKHQEEYELPLLNKEEYVYVVISEATEENDGLSKYTYTKDNQIFIFEVVLPRLEHTHKYEAKVTLPTCEAQGYTTYACKCGDSYIDNYRDALGHDIVELEAKEETCTEPGSTKGEYCTRCDYKVAQEIIPAKGHKYEAKVTLPTCEEKGYTTYTCHCGESYIDDYIDALGHDIVELEAKEETCTETGLTKGEYCTRCDYKVAQEIIPAKGHKYEAKVTEATCLTKGYTTYTCYCGDSYIDNYTDALGHNIVELEAKEETCTETGLTQGEYCTRCDYKVAQEIIPAKGHKYEAKVTEATCLTKGYTTYTCHCGDSYIDDYIDALGHDIVELEAKEETCTETGLTQGEYCTRCDYKVAQEIIPAKGHKYEAKVTEATCLTKGYTTYTCYCGDSYIDDYIDALGHNIVELEAKEETCTETGLTKGEYCTRCDYKVAQEIVPAKGHKYEAKVTLPTCEAQGYTTYTCHCGDSYIDNYTEALGHDIVELEAKEETCTETGLTKGEYCTRCDYKVAQEIIPAKGHKYEAKVTEATCLTQGYTTYTCHCGESYIDDYIDALGHDIVELEAKEETCTETGLTKGEYCTRCDYKVAQEIIPAKGHKYEAKVTEATCLTKGYTTYTCYCGDSYIDNYTDALGHNIVELEAKEETCTETGLTKGKYCTRCDYKVAQEIIPAKGHKYEAKVTLPTCEIQGYTTYTCKCGDSYIDNYTDSIDHQLSDWIVDKEPSETEEGHKYKKCTICDEIITEETISKLPKTKRGCRSNEVIKVIALINTMMVCSFVIRRKRR